MEYKGEENGVPEMLLFCEQAESVGDYEGLYDLSLVLIEKAPRSQMSYNYYFEAAYRLGRSDKDEYVINRALSMNESMNKRCRYLTRNKEIIIPRGVSLK